MVSGPTLKGMEKTITIELNKIQAAIILTAISEYKESYEAALSENKISDEISIDKTLLAAEAAVECVYIYDQIDSKVSQL